MQGCQGSQQPLDGVSVSAPRSGRSRTTKPPPCALHIAQSYVSMSNEGIRRVHGSPRAQGPPSPGPTGAQGTATMTNRRNRRPRAAAAPERDESLPTPSNCNMLSNLLIKASGKVQELSRVQAPPGPRPARTDRDGMRRRPSRFAPTACPSTRRRGSSCARSAHT